MTILSILIPTTPDRKKMFTRLFNELHRQLEYMNTFHPSLGEIEIIVDDTKKFLQGGLSIGKKRESLVKRASGKYLCFVDSDDFISPNYMETLVRLCHEDNDVICFNNISKLDNFWMVVNMSLHNDNEQAEPGIIKRKPWHICPVRSEFAKLYDFPDSNYGEDWTWMEQVLSHCKTQSVSSAILHQYNHSAKVSEADRITNHTK